VSFGKLCSWCTVTAAAALATSYIGRDVIAETACTVNEIAMDIVSD
jgi:hypothetical protein